MELGGALHSGMGLPTVGILFGYNAGATEVIVKDAVDAAPVEGTVAGDTFVLDVEVCLQKKDLWVGVDPNIELIGWYTFGEFTEANMTLCKNIHKSLIEADLALTPVMMLLNPNPDPEGKSLPLKVFESDQAVQSFTELDFSLVSMQAERIAVDQVVKSTPTNGVSTFEIQCSTMLASMRNLYDLVDTLAGKEGPDGLKRHPLKVRRLMSKIVHQLDAVDSPLFEVKHTNELANAALVSSLASMTNVIAEANDAAQKIRKMKGSCKASELSSFRSIGIEDFC